MPLHYVDPHMKRGRLYKVFVQVMAGGVRI
jgi:hypothetical protein